MTDRAETYTKSFIEQLPKSDLHVHLDGSLRLGTLIELAREQKVKLPSSTQAGLKEKVFKRQYKNLEEYLVGFRYTVAALQTPEALERAAYELAWDNIDEGVLYVEVRFAPQLHVNSDQDMDRVIQSVNAGLSRAKLEQNTLQEVRSGVKPPFEYGIICCALRQFGRHYSPYYASLYDVHPYTPAKEVYPIASLELAKAAVEIRNRRGVPIVGFDLAGEEAGYPAEDHQQAFDYVHRHFIKKTVHAGEAFGPESIFQAITDLKADRIGHGYYLFQIGAITDGHIQDKHRYVRDLAEYIADRRITIEVCLTSNMQTNPRIASLEHHAFRKMHKANLSTTFCTDNRLVSDTTVTKELHLAANTFELKRRELKDIIIYGFKRSFFPGTYMEKRSYVRRIIDHYELIEREHFGQIEPKQ